MRCNHTYKKCLSVQILIEDKKAVGVSFIRDGRKHVISAKREVILSGGSVSSPQILMLSGIGPKEHLQSLGVSFLSIDLLLHGSKNSLLNCLKKKEKKRIKRLKKTKQENMVAIRALIDS